VSAQEIKEALRRRHPAVAEYGGPGPWTTLEEWANIDLLAFSAWSSPSAYGDAACSLGGHGWGDKKVEPQGEFNPDADHYNAGGPHQEWTVCATCKGRGYMRKSVVEEEAPTLWIPNDVGLIEVHPNGRCHVVRKAPLGEPTHPMGDLCQLIRWVSYRPDPRHVAEAERQANSHTILAAA